jgi:urease accessory protein
VILIESVLGNISDDAWRNRLEGAHVDWLNLDQWEAQKTRIRKASSAGSEVAISLSRGVFLRDGDILFWDQGAKQAIAARISVREVMVVRLEGLAAQSPVEIARSCIELGHALGNQHWPAVVKGDCVFVPLTVDRRVMSSVMKTHAIPGIQYEFVSGTEVIPHLAPHESRRLFGGAEGPVHSHTHSPEAEHSHTHSGEQPHHHPHAHK